MNKNIQKVLVRRQYKDQIWFEVLEVNEYERTHTQQISLSRQARRDNKSFNGSCPTEGNSFRQDDLFPRRLLAS